MDPFEPLKYQKPLMALKGRIAEEGSKAVFGPLIEKFILNNPHRVTIEMQVTFWPHKGQNFSCRYKAHFDRNCLITMSVILVSQMQRRLHMMKQLRENSWMILRQV